MGLPLPRRGAKAAILAAALAACLFAAPGAYAAPAAPQLHVSGNHLVDSSGSQVVLHGMDRSGAEFACVQGKGIFDGPKDQASGVAVVLLAAASAIIRAVSRSRRVPRTGRRFSLPTSTP